MFKYIFVTLFLLLSSIETYSQFVVKDVLAVSPDASIFDPEYNTKLNLVCWKSDNNELWVSGLDPVTHLYKPSNGKGTYVTDNLAPNTGKSVNGPEWMLCSQSTQIVYTKELWGIRYPGISTKSLGGWHSFTLLQYPKVVYSMATNNYADSIALFLFETDHNDGIYWVRNTDFNTSFSFPNVTLGFFAYDNQQIGCATNKTRNPGFIETNKGLPYFTSISSDTIGAPFLWRDPASNSRLFMYRTNGNKTLKIFQEIATNFWVLYKQFNSPLPDPFNFITSPEPFVCGGRSYISFMAAQSGVGKDCMPAQIWLASADPSDSLMRRVSDSTIGIRTDPEPVVFNDSAFIYYTDVLTSNNMITQFSVRKCNTGLGNLLTDIPTNKQVNSEISVYPNPSKGLFNFKSDVEFGPGTVAKIYDMNGSEVFNKLIENNSTELNLYELPDGNYLLKLQNRKHSAVTKIIIKR